MTWEVDAPLTWNIKIYIQVQVHDSEINSIVDLYVSWIAQLVRALARKGKGPGSSPGPG